MIIVTGGAGFIGSALVWTLNKLGRNDIIIVDKFGTDDKWKNLVALKFMDVFDSEDFGQMLAHDFLKKAPFETIVHLGACSATTERNFDFLLRNNYEYSKYLCEKALSENIRFIYASSAATYGAGEHGYSDDESKLNDLCPLNAYGYSKQMFDLWANNQKLLQRIVGLKFFNVFGPNEYHKDDMRSMVHKAFCQVKETGKARLFKSTSPDYGDGEHKRDFIYIKDAVDMILFFMNNKIVNGIYNVGTGKATTFNDLIKPVFKGMGVPGNIEYIDMPEALVDRYQDYTQADMTKIKNAGYTKEPTPIEDAVLEYVKEHLNTDKPHLH